MKKICLVFVLSFLGGHVFCQSINNLYQFSKLNMIERSHLNNNIELVYTYDELGNRTAIIIPCQPPVNLAAENVAEESAIISWQKVGSFTSWNIKWGESDFNPASQGNFIQDITELQYTLTNLDPETAYDVYVNSNCAESEQSEWRGPCSFTTPGAVLAIYDVTGGGSYCETDLPNGEVNLSGSQAGAVYQLYKDGMPEGQLKNGTGASLSWFDLAHGIFTVEGTRNQISGWMSGSITVSEIGIPVVYAGADATITPEESYLLSDASAENYSNIMWASMGDGIFSEPDVVNPTYIPGSYDIATGYVELSMIASPIAPCFVFAEDYISLYLMVPPPQQVINLNSGWSGISSYIAPEQTAVSVLLQPIINDLVILQGVNGLYWPGENINTLLDWNPYAGYKIKVNQTTTLSITGSNITNKTILLDEGWNLIPVLANCYTQIEDLFNETGIIIAKEVSGTAVYWPAYGINTLQVLSPGQAYFVLMDNDTQITFPDCESGEGIPANQNNIPSFKNEIFLPGEFYQKTANTHTIALPVSVISQLKEYEYIGVFNYEDQCMGYSVISNFSEAIAITAFGDDATTPNVDGLKEGELMYFQVFNPYLENKTMVNVGFDEKMPQTCYFTNHGLSAITNIELTGLEDFESSPLFVDIHPNPSTGRFNVSLNRANPVDCEVFDIHGGSILKFNKQSNQFSIDLSSYPKGIYYLKLTQGELQAIRKLVLQ